MSLVLSQEPRMLRESALEFFGNRLPIANLRHLRDTADPQGYDRAAWREMAELGWAGILVPESHGGSAFGHAGLGQVLEAGGRTPAATPLVATALLAARTGARWTVTVTNNPREPPLAEQGRSAETARRAAAQSHPLVQAILAAFPGATIEAVRDAGADDYGLPLTPAARTADPDDDGRDFAPPEAESAWTDDELPNDD